MQRMVQKDGAEGRVEDGLEPAGENVVRALVGSDWIGCRQGRKTSSGGTLTIGGMAVRSWRGRPSP